jgi:hypothetical protein
MLGAAKYGVSITDVQGLVRALSQVRVTSTLCESAGLLSAIMKGAGASVARDGVLPAEKGEE